MASGCQPAPDASLQRERADQDLARRRHRGEAAVDVPGRTRARGEHEIAEANRARLEERDQGGVIAARGRQSA